MKKPILVTGVSLSFLLWFWQGFTTQIADFGEIGFTLLIILAGLFYFTRPQRPSSPTVLVDESTFHNYVNNLKKLINLFEQKYQNETEGAGFSQQLNTIINQYQNKINQQELLTANILTSNYLSSLKITEKLSQEFKLFQFNTSGLTSINLQELTNVNLKSDLILLVIQGDITQSEKIIITTLANNYHQILIVFDQSNHQEKYDQETIAKQIVKSLNKVINEKEIVKICSQEKNLKVKKYIDENNYQESTEIYQANYQELIQKLEDITVKEINKLALKSALRQTIKLQKDIYEELNKLRKKEALPVIEKYQWIASATTFANPVSSLDLVAVSAINTQMIMDLGEIYQQHITLSQAGQIALELGKIMLGLGLVEMSTQAIATILKANTITYVAGGILQAISSAYLTRICSLSLIEYLEKQEIDFEQKRKFKLNLDTIKNILINVFEENKSKALLSSFVKETVLKIK